MSLKKDISSAKTIALKYLSHAPKSSREVELKLKEKGFTEDEISETIIYLRNLGYINDEMFAKNWANSKIKSRFWGKKKILLGLKQKGIPDELLKQVAHDLTETSELNTANFALKKWLKTKKIGRTPDSDSDGKKLMQKAFNYLQTKGFSTSVIITIIRKYNNEIEIYEGQ